MNDHRPTLEIRDPEIDAQALLRRVTEGIAQRRAAGAYDLDVVAAGPGSLRPGRQTPAGRSTAAEFPGLNESLAELIARGHLYEPGFHSQTPVMGQLIVAVRRLWNWMSTKWYVRPILAQQSDVNLRTARLLCDLAQWQQMESQRLPELEAKVAELEARLEARDEQ